MILQVAKIHNNIRILYLKNLKDGFLRHFILPKYWK